MPKVSFKTLVTFNFSHFRHLVEDAETSGRSE